MHHFLQFFLFCGKNIWFSLCGYLLRQYVVYGHKKKTSVMPVFCIVFLQLSLLNFSLCLVARFKALSNSSLRTNNEYMYISIFSFSLFVSFRLKVCGLLPLPSSESVGRTLLIACYRSLSPTYPLQPLLQIG